VVTPYICLKFLTYTMRIHNRSTLIDYIENYPLADKALRSWYSNTEKASWENSAALKEQYGNASIINNKLTFR
jgi:mRNA-degrading endonuclease HigB of HigAB toxin-antitoxin module